MAKTNRVYLLLGWLAGRLVMGSRALNHSEDMAPETPVVSMYLYGTPSTSGNIGLRNGESVTYYDGEVLPPVPTELKYNNDNIEFPYAIIEETLVPAAAGVYLILVSAPLRKVISDTGKELLRPDYDTYPSYYYYRFELNDSHAWKDAYPFPGVTSNPKLVSDKSGLFGTSEEDYRFIWTSHDILDENEEVFLEYRKPIPVSDIVGYSYNGDVLSALPEYDKATYPHLYIYYMSNRKRYRAIATTQESVTRTGLNASGEEVLSIPYISPFLDTSFIDGSWNEWAETTSLSSVPLAVDGKAVNVLTWSNHDILNEDGTIYFGKSADPIPVYGLVGYLND